MKQLLFSILILMSLTCQKKEDNETQQPMPSQHKILLSLDTALSKLPEEFLALNPMILYNNLAEISYLPPYKDEYETTAEYKIRRNNFIDSVLKIPIMENLTLESIYTIQLDGPQYDIMTNSGWDVSYDADNETMIITIKFGDEYTEVPNYFDEDLSEIKRKFTSSPLWSSEYVKKEYESLRIYDEVWIKLSSLNNLSNYFKLDENKRVFTYNATMKITRESAKQVKENLKLMAFIKIIKPWHDWRDISLQTHGRIMERGIIFAQILQLWIYNYKTGEIYFKLKD